MGIPMFGGGGGGGELSPFFFFNVEVNVMVRTNDVLRCPKVKT